MLIAKNRPINPSIPILRYQTPKRIFIGQSGNMTIAKTIASAPAAYSFVMTCDPSYSHTKCRSSRHSCCCSIFTVQSPLTRLPLATGPWSWPSCGSTLETRRARSESGRSLKTFSREARSVMGGRRAFLERAFS